MTLDVIENNEPQMNQQNQKERNLRVQDLFKPWPQNQTFINQRVKCVSQNNHSYSTRLPLWLEVTQVAGTLSTRSIEGFHFEDGLISRFYFVPNSSNLVSQVLLCARRFHTLNRGISFRRIQILLSSFWKRDRENVFYQRSNSGQMFLRY